MRTINQYYLAHPDDNSITIPHEIGRMLLPYAVGKITVPTIYGYPLTFNLDEWDGELNGSIERNLYFLGTYEAGTLDTMSRSDVSRGTFIDVGGHLGVMTTYMAKVGAASRVLTFEPNPRMIPLLHQNIALNGLKDTVMVYPIGLGAQSARGKLVETSGNSGMTSIQRNSDESTILIEPLDAVLRSHNYFDLPPVSLIKIDVEGDELNVLSGAQNTIAKFKPDLIIEYTPGRNHRDLLDFLGGYGYEVFILAKGRHRLSSLIPFNDNNASSQRADNLFCYQLDSRGYPNISSKVTRGVS